MAWIPKTNVIDTTRIDANILAFIAANQAEALFWANNGAALKIFNFLADNVENLDLPNLPTLTVTGSEEAFNYDADILQTNYRIDFESIVFDKDGGLLPALTKKYATALKSMLANISPVQLLGGAGGEQATRSRSISANYREIAVSSRVTGFIQVFQIKAVFELEAASETF